MFSPIDLVQKLQGLITSTYSGNISDPLELYKAKHTITNLCLSLLQAVQGPEEYTAILAESCQESSALNVITSLGVADHIAASSEGQLSLKELSKKTNADEKYLSVTLSALILHGYFIEVGQFGSQIYANNSFSDILRTDSTTQDGKSMKDAIGLSADDGAKATTRLLEAADLQSSGKTAANIAFGSSQSLFEWMHNPGNEWRGKRAGKAMVQLHSMANMGVGEDYSWETLKSPIVDVGGGIGSLQVMLFSVPKNKELSFVIFDLEKTVDHAKKAWGAKPQWMQDRVSFVAGDFMKPSPADSKIPTAAGGAGTYVIRHVLHDWSDPQVIEILKHVRNAMLEASSPAQTPKLVVVEMMLTESSSRFTRTTSLQLLSLNGGITRTQVEFRRLFDEAGFAVESVHEVRGVDLIVELTPTSQ
ncbi:S-adenosyl-L-methionine-dependent methyltransferase [Lyophyllum atratum]|nr:S-adenosyl-L-methionine-dependent methyltransferase [Lyophyllum atratum]